jgi:hypothetical protein
MTMQRVAAYDVRVSQDDRSPARPLPRRAGARDDPGVPDRVAALSEQLIEAHRTLREGLASLRHEVADGRARPDFPEDLHGHCLSFCSSVHTHHTSEDNQVFPALRAAAPELAPVIDKLAEDHSLVAGILEQVRELLASWPVSPPAALLRELDGLTAILESHFSFEERRIARTLDTLDPGSIDL